MPTIGQLPPASSVSDIDEIPIFQNGQTLAATRAQMLAGVQAALSLPQDTLLGGVGPGNAAPVAINIGANLALSGNTLSATAAPFVIAGQATGTVPEPADVVPLSQAGNNFSVSYANFMAGMANVAGLPAGAMTATAAGGSALRSLAALAGNAVAIEDFGAAGDGVTDDSAALLAALASGNPVRLGPKTYAIAGECDISGGTCTLLGVPGLTAIRRSAQSKLGLSSPVAWISIASATLFIDGIIFDANSALTADDYAVIIQPECVKSMITRSVFKNAMGPMNGSGLTIAASDPVLTQHHIESSEFFGNAVNGVRVYAADAVSITNCHAHDNTQNGILVDSQDPTFTLKIRELQIVGNTCWNNNCGIIVGNFNVTNTGQLVYGNANPDVLGAVIAANNCYDNSGYGIYISGRNILVSGNLCTNNSSIGGSGAGILCDTGYCKVTGNMISGASAFGIDCGGSIYTEVANNYVNGAYCGINIGGGRYCIARDNFIQDSTAIAIAAQNVESDGRGTNFNLTCVGLSIIGNWITYAGEVYGIMVRDAAQEILVADNVIFANPGADLTRALSAYTDSVVLRGNLLNYTEIWPVNPALVNGVYTLIVPDIADHVAISQSSAPIASIMTSQANAVEGQIVYCKLISGGVDYTHASVSFSGSGGNAAASAWISGGAILGIQMANNGSGYGPGTTVTINGDGSGATAVVQVGLPILQNRKLSIDCLSSVTFSAAGSVPAQSNWTGSPVTVPAGASIDWIGANGGWRAQRFSQSDYVSPNGDGSMTLRTQSGDISLHPAGSGVVRILSDSESTGAVELIGRGSPLNVVAAPPGSSFRNLNGGAGQTFWVKQAGTGTANWVAIA
ncbi:MAG: right-handed parallel beta-helix repeat-containing protein [Acidocella sp.]|nr:right-handed parallel beta-helix repeat-containing protein [Acidocella sp.]